MTPISWLRLIGCHGRGRDRRAVPQLHIRGPAGFESDGGGTAGSGAEHSGGLQHLHCPPGRWAYGSPDAGLRMHIEDVQWCVAELARMRQLGSRAFMVTRQPTMSLTHPDFEPLWWTAEDLEMLVYVHVFFGRPQAHPSWGNNGRGLAGFREGVSAPDQRAEIRNFVNAMVFDGVLERHPNLQILISEAGYSVGSSDGARVRLPSEGLRRRRRRGRVVLSLPLLPWSIWRVR